MKRAYFGISLPEFFITPSIGLYTRAEHMYPTRNGGEVCYSVTTYSNAILATS